MASLNLGPCDDHFSELVARIQPPLGGDDGKWLERLRYLDRSGRRGGMTTEVAVYSESYAHVFETLDRIDDLLHERRYLCGGDLPTSADWYLACWLVRFDLVFYPHYKLNRQRLVEFGNLAHLLRDLARHPEFRATLDVDAIKRSYFLENELINPKKRLPLGGGTNLEAPDDRALRFAPEVSASGTEEDEALPRKAGEWVRRLSHHRNWITADGSSGFPAERGRYHLYVSNNCPWSHRARLARRLKGLEDVVSMDVLFYRRDPQRGWQFRPEEPGCTADTLFGHRFLTELYEQVGSAEKSLPVLWDKISQTIVSNESADIIRMFNTAFDAFGRVEVDLDLYPKELREQIDRVNAFTYHAINNGAYKAGFASSQRAYEDAYRRIFDAFDLLECMLEGRTFLLGGRPTEADLRLFPTIFRFDAIYYTRFLLNERQVADLPHLNRWLQRMLEVPGVRQASDLDHCRKGYFGRTGNNIVPLGPKGR